MSMGPGGIGQSGGHAPSNLNDNMAPVMPPTSMMQSQMSNGEIWKQAFIFSTWICFSHINPDLACTHTCLSDPDDTACLFAAVPPCLNRHRISLTVFPHCLQVKVLCSANGPTVRFVFGHSHYCFLSVSNLFWHSSLKISTTIQASCKDELNVGSWLTCCGTSWERVLAALTLRVCRQAPATPTCSSSHLVRCSRLFPQHHSACPPAASVARPQPLATANPCPPHRAAWSKALGQAMALPPLLPLHPHPLLPPPAATSTCSPTKVS